MSFPLNGAKCPLTLFNDRHESDLAKMFRNFWRKSFQCVANAEDEMLLLEGTHHDAVYFAGVNHSEKNYA